MQKKIRKPILVDYVYLIGLALLWSSSFVFIKIAVLTIPPITMTAARLFFGILGVVVIYLFTKKGTRSFLRLLRDKKLLFFCLLSAFFGNVAPFSLIAFGETKIDSSTAAVIMGIMPLMTLGFAHLSTQDEKLNFNKTLGIIFGFIGVVILIGYDVLIGQTHLWFYQVLVALGALCYAINSIIMKKISDKEQIFSAIIIMSFAFVLILPLMFFIEGNQIGSLFDAPLMATLSVVALGIFHAGLAVIIMFKILENCGAVFFSQINFIIPLLGFFWGIILLGEPFAINLLIALACILIGLFITRR